MKRKIAEIRDRLAKRQEPTMAKCSSCHRKQEMPRYSTIASGMVDQMWRCSACGQQLFLTFTTGGNEPSPDDDIRALLDLIARSPGAVPEAPDVRPIVKAFSFDPTNHHNALACSYCNPHRLSFAVPEARPHEDYAFEQAHRLCDELRPIIESDDAKRAVIRRYLTSAIVHGMKELAEARSPVPAPQDTHDGE
jgi:DNA-directed RNA polymerase subunit RPC12/RpoP